MFDIVGFTSGEHPERCSGGLQIPVGIGSGALESCLAVLHYCPSVCMASQHNALWGLKLKHLCSLS